MNCNDTTILIEIGDNGIGFDPQKAIGHTGHYGLVGIRERARLYGGSLTINSHPSLGSTLKIQLPIKGEVENE